MDESTKYAFEHIGDTFSDTVEKVLEWLKNSTKGISLTYRIHCLETDQEKAYAKIGKRTATLRTRYPQNELFNDDDMREFFSTLDSVDEELAEANREREERLYPGMTAAQEPA